MIQEKYLGSQSAPSLDEIITKVSCIPVDKAFVFWYGVESICATTGAACGAGADSQH
jgi:hypothetical protein